MPTLPAGKLHFTAGPIMAAVDNWEIVLTGVGRGFCSGADMRRDTPAELKGENFVGNRNIPEGGDAARERFFHGFTKLHRDISLIRKPTIAMINGPAVGAGIIPPSAGGAMAASASTVGSLSGAPSMPKAPPDGVAPGVTSGSSRVS